MRAAIGILGLCVGLVMGASGCADAPEPDQADQHVDMSLSSTAFQEGHAIPRAYTCDGPGLRVPLQWSVQGEEVMALALFVQDVDANAGSGFYVHWLVLDLPAESAGLGERERLPKGAVAAKTSLGTTEWVPPCPPAGDGTHRYEFTLYALEHAVELPAGVDAAAGQAEIFQRALATRRLVGTVTR